MENQDMTRFTLRIPRELLLKLGYIADYYGRTKNKELEQMIRSRIKSFESKHNSAIARKNRLLPTRLRFLSGLQFVFLAFRDTFLKGKKISFLKNFIISLLSIH